MPDGTTPGPSPEYPIESLARSLTDQQRIAYIPGDVTWLPGLLDTLEQFLKATYEEFQEAAQGQGDITRSAEWVMDNFYIVRRALRQVQDNLPEGYYRQLPKLAEGPLASRPRVYELARAYLLDREYRPGYDSLSRFIVAFQQHTPLTMGELWAFPTLLRLTLIEALVATLARVLQGGATSAAYAADELLPETLDTDEVVARVVPALRWVDTQEWEAFFEATSRVEEVLRQDPSGHYALMDFDTRDRYRKVIETLARNTPHPEEAVAKEAIRLAQASRPRARDFATARYAHIGYYLLDEGRRELERVLDYEPPTSEALKRALLTHPTLLYLGSIALLTVLLMLLPLSYGAARDASWLQMLVIAVVTLIPASTVAVSLVNWVVTHTLPPRVLPKVDLSDGIPPEFSTVVVVPALLTSAAEVDDLFRQLELHYLRNTDDNLRFALLTDFADAPEQVMPQDEALIARATARLEELNARYEHESGAPFYFLHRRRRRNLRENAWMGWERKRGKLEEFNRLLLDPTARTSYAVTLGALEHLRPVRYVITLDADTVLPRDGAALLVGTLAHPLNRAEFDERDKVRSGYTLLQPRTEILPTSAGQSRFTRVFAGDTGLDLYTNAVSDVYQDLFGEGIFVGKGIYEVASFERSLAGRTPENALLSHDLFEGVHGRAGLVTDVVLFEEYPPHYLVQVRRSHRWVRGDWQLLPWLLFRVPTAEGKRPNTLAAIDRWKMLDNLRRSLLPPSLIALFTAGWLWLPGSPLVWTLAGVLTPAFPSLLGLVAGALRGFGGSLVAARRTLRENAIRWLLALAFLPYETLLNLDAIATTLNRLFITRRRMLQWTSAAHTVRLVGTEVASEVAWRQMIPALALTSTITLLLLVIAPASLLVAAPLLLAWFLSPQIAYWVSRPIRRQKETITDPQRHRLRRLARRTWFFFERFVGPEDHWLPPDHFQEEPRGTVAHRTSPTNIGLLLLSTLAARDFGYLDTVELTTRLKNTLASLDEVEQYRGHILNWIDTRSLESLAPRYVSMVDSGNLAGSLWALRQGCLALPRESILRWERWEGLLDTLGVLHETVEKLAREEPLPQSDDAYVHLRELRLRIGSHRPEPGESRPSRVEEWVALFLWLEREGWPEAERRLVAVLEAGAELLDVNGLRNLRRWTERVRHHLAALRREWTLLQPWLLAQHERPALLAPGGELAETWESFEHHLPLAPPMSALPALCLKAESRVTDLKEQIVRAAVGAEARRDAIVWCENLAQELAAARTVSEELIRDCEEIAIDADRLVQAMDFAFLYDRKRHLFHIGYNVDAGRLDANYYDLLATEARTGSLVAIAKGDVPQSHWLHLGRPVTEVEQKLALLSWSGTMFEYLMPPLLLRRYDGTLLTRSESTAVDCQVAYGESHGVPWGISESGYYQFDAQMNYQYQAFGVPQLGFKRGLAEHLVIAPYASMMAVAVRPQTVLNNLTHLTDEGLMGDFGLFEAVDYTRARLPLGQDRAIVRSYMAHHQGMLFIALLNYLMDDPMVERFHATRRVQSVELLLQEQVPQQAPLEIPPEQESAVARQSEPSVQADPWHVPVHAPMPQAHYLSNGTYGVMVTSAGAGYSRCGDTMLTRWRADTTQDDWGTWLYVQDLERGDYWSATYQPTAVRADHEEVFFHPHMAEFHRRDGELMLGMQVTVIPGENVEVRRVTLTNNSDSPRHLRMVSYGEVVLGEQEADKRHPAFQKLFVESERLPNQRGLLLRRRPRASHESPLFLVHTLVPGPDAEPLGDLQVESDRLRFLGRGQVARWPQVLQERGPLSGTTGATLDPILSLAQEILLPPHTSVEFALLNVFADSRREVLDVIERVGNWMTISEAFDEARTLSQREMARLDVNSDALQQFQQLLSLLLYPHPVRRAAAETLMANRRGQPGLWGYAISGDFPILLVRLRDEEETDLVRELLRAHTLWRDRNLKIDLVILNEKTSGYAQEVQGRLHRLLDQMNSDGWLNQRGGIFLLRSDQMAPEDQVLLQSMARVILDGSGGSLGEQLSDLFATRAELPRLSVTRPPDEPREPTPPLSRPEGLLFDNGVGGFSPDGREYVIYLDPESEVPHPPAPWSNVIANPDFGFLVTESGGGGSWAINSGENRLTPWSNDPVSDEPGEALFLRDEETGEVWSPTPLPAGTDEPYLVRHGAGYTTFEHHSHGLRQHLALFAAPDAPVKIIRLRLENHWSRTRRLTATYYLPWVLGTFRDQAQSFIQPRYDSERFALLARNPYNVEFGARVAFLATSRQPHGLTTDRTEFLGRMRTLRQPASLERIGLTGRVEAGVDPCAAMQLHLDLEPNESQEIFFLLGQGADHDEALRVIERFREPGAIEATWQAVHDFWNDLLGTIQVETPEASMNILLNRWLLYQNLSCRVWGRSAFYQSSGAYGFRDQLQDAMSLLHTAPGVARAQIVRAGRHQFEAGDVLHWWHPPSGRGVRTQIRDDLLWLPFVAAEYLSTTGDESVLDEEVPFLQGEPLGPDEEERYGEYAVTSDSYTIYEHCRRALERGTTSGPHGLPLIGAGDWNDGMNRVGIEGRGESVWLGWFLHATLTRFAPLAEARGDHGAAERYRRRARELQEALEAHAWDGAWYRRAYYDDGTPLGSRKNRECRIDSIAQSWSVLSGAGDPERARQAMESVWEHLVRLDEGLLLLFTPPFNETPKDPGYIKGYLPGIRENGGQYTHAALWTIWAFAALGEAERAEQLFRLLNPICHTDTLEAARRYRAEPYSVAADVYGVPPHVGRGGWTWYTGSAGWMYRVGVEAILGFQRKGDKLRIDPALPSAWPGYFLTYRHGETRYHIQVERSADGPRTLLNGEPVADGSIHLVDDGQHHQLLVQVSESKTTSQPARV